MLFPSFCTAYFCIQCAYDSYFVFDVVEDHSISIVILPV